MRGWNKHARERETALVTLETPWWDSASRDAFGDAQFPSLVEQLELVRAAGERLYAEQVDLYKSLQARTRRGDSRMHESIMRSGTLTDKMAALALQVRDHPFYSLKELRALVAASAKKGRRESEMAFQQLADLFCQSQLMPRHRRLVSLAKRPVMAANGTVAAGDSVTLLVWYVEDQLKVAYGQFVEALAQGSKDTMTHHKDEVMKIAYQLVCNVPELELETLSLVINKAGDKEKRIASRVPYLLGLLLQSHSNMRLAVVREVERALYRPGMKERAKYYLVIFLTQVVLRTGDTELAKSLTQIYFSFLARILDDRTSKEDFAAARKLKRLRKLKKEDAISTSQAKQLQRLKQDRKRRRKDRKDAPTPEELLDSKMLTALLTGVSRAFPYLAEGDRSMFDGHMETFYAVVNAASFNKSCHALSLLLRILVARNDVPDRFYTTLYAVLMRPEAATSTKQALFLNVVYRAIRTDTSTVRVRAFIKRLLQVALHVNSAFCCAILVVVSELLRVHEDARQLVTGVAAAEDVIDDDAYLLEDNQEVDDNVAAVGDGDDALAAERAHQLAQLNALIESKKLEHADDNAVTPVVAAAAASSTVLYNAAANNPLRSGADTTCAWELSLLAAHTHPSVRAFVEQLAELRWIEYAGDPLLDFSVGTFLDRLAYREPKAKGPREAVSHERTFQSKRHSFVETTPAPNGEEFAARPVQEVRPEERFIHEHMRSKFAGKGVRSYDSDQDDGYDGDDRFEVDDLLNDFGGGGDDDDFDDEDMFEGESDELDLDEDELSSDEELEEGDLDFDFDAMLEDDDEEQLDAETYEKTKKQKRKK